MAKKVNIVTVNGSFEFELQGNFTTIQRYLNQAKRGEVDATEGKDGGFFATIDTGAGRLVLNPDHVVAIEELKES